MPLFFKPKQLPLTPLERKISVPNGVRDEGLIEGILQKIGFDSRFCVEFGAGDGYNHSFTRNLIENHDFSAFLIEADDVLSEKLTNHYSDKENIHTLKSFITRDNIEKLFTENHVPKNLDVLIIDIDTTDYHIWKAIQNFEPRLICIEFNPSFPPPEVFIIEYKDDFVWKGDDYYGASMQAMVDLGKEKGYELIHCTSGGDNLYFVKKEFFHLLDIQDNSPETMYQIPQYGKYGRARNGKGHPTSKRTSTAKQRFINKLRYYLMSIPRKL